MQLIEMLKTKRCVGVVFQPARMYCRRVVSGIAAFGAEAGWDWSIVPCEGPSAPVGPLTATLDGVVGHFSDPRAAIQLVLSGLPAVDISPAPKEARIVRVASDDQAVGRLAALYLMSLGLIHFGYCGWSERDDSRAREAGFRQTIAYWGLSCSSFLSPATESAMTSLSGEADEELARWVFSLPKPAAILASNDRRALQVLAVCQKLKIDIPDSVAVLGVDNDDVFCELAQPTLSSIALSTQQIGYEAARTLGHLMDGQELKEITHLIPPVGVVPRESSGLKAIVDNEVAAAVRYIALHAKDDLRVADVLREVDVSRRSLDQRFLKILGHTTAQEISRAQVELAKQALTQTDESMTRVAVMAGFSSAKQLGASFRHLTGSTPTAYRRHCRH